MAPTPASSHADPLSPPPVRASSHNNRKDVRDDPRVDPQLLSAMTKVGLDRYQSPPVSVANRPDLSDPLALCQYMAANEAALEQALESIPIDLPEDKMQIELDQYVEMLPGPDQRHLGLHIIRPAMRGGPLPCIMTVQGIGMTIMKPTTRIFTQWARSLAAHGIVVISVHFRKACSNGESNPFPAGLHDVCAAMRWIHSKRAQLDIRSLVIQGHSGGANLVLAAAMKAKQQGWSAMIDGVVACSPTISGAYGWPSYLMQEKLPSLVEFNGYFFNVGFQASMAQAYGPKPEDMTNPLVWPYFATEKDLRGLPPHLLFMDELDPFRDEGIAYHRKLRSAGVNSVGHINLGQTHMANLIFRQALGWANRSTVRDVAAFTKYIWT